MVYHLDYNGISPSSLLIMRKAYPNVKIQHEENDEEDNDDY